MGNNRNQISYGSQGSDVTDLQKLLNKSGYNLAEDGIYGSKTKSAVLDYQKKNGLVADGIVGSATWGKIGTPIEVPTNPIKYETMGSANQPVSDGGNQPTVEKGGWTYGDFQPSQPTTEAGDKRSELETQKPGDFSYGEYAQSDVVKQAEAMLQEQLANKPGEYQSQWQSQLDDMLNKILNREKFSYDLNGDALYQQYKDQYTTQGQMAMMDTMGQAAAMTGGFGNSYAQSVGQQAYQGHLQQLNNVIPELYQIALNQYNREGDDLYNQYGLFADRENQDYGRYRDSVSDYNTERDYLTNRYYTESEMDYNRFMDAYNRAYGEHRDSVADWQYELGRADNNYWNQYDRDYGQYADDRSLAYDDYWNSRNFEYQQGRDQVSDEQWQAEFDEAKRQYDQQYAAKYNGASSSGGTGSSGGRGSGYDNAGLGDAVIKNLQKALGVTADGKWGPQSQAAAEKYGARDAAHALQLYNQGKLGTPLKQYSYLPAARETDGGANKTVEPSKPTGSGIDFEFKDSTRARDFRNNVMTTNEFNKHNGVVQIGGKEYEFGSYAEYLEAALDREEQAGRISSTDVYYLMNYYGL